MGKDALWKRLKSQVEVDGVLEVQLANSIFSESLSEEDGYYNQDSHIDELEQIFLKSEIRWIGSSNDYHNLAVEFSKADRNRDACIVLEKGLNEYPVCVDLLGDYLKYGTSDVQWEKCENCYQVLKSLDRSDWNWRAYSFSIDYLLEKRKKIVSPSERKSIRSEVLRLAKNFVEKIGSDLAYFDLANVYNVFNDKEREKSTLEAAIANNMFSPRCSLRLADLDISVGNYEVALERLQICQIAFKAQSDINLAYVYLLKALSKSSLLLNEILKVNEPNSICEEDVYSIYKDYNSAIAIGLDGVMKKTADTVMAVIENQTEIKNNKGQRDAEGF